MDRVASRPQSTKKTKLMETSQRTLLRCAPHAPLRNHVWLFNCQELTQETAGHQRACTHVKQTNKQTQFAFSHLIAI